MLGPTDLVGGTSTWHATRNPVSWKIHIRAINGPETEYAILVFCITREARQGKQIEPSTNTCTSFDSRTDFSLYISRIVAGKDIVGEIGYE